MKGKDKPKLSLIFAASDGLELTCQAIRSARECSFPSEIIVVDNASKDGTADWLKGQSDVMTLKTETLVSYGTAINMGLRSASKDSDYLAVLNNDLIFTKGWDEKLIEVIEHPQWLQGVDKIGIAGPMSNHAAGFQLLKNARYNLSQLDTFAKKLEITVMKNENDPKIMRAGFLSGFCWIMTRECYEAVGDMETFEPLGFEDNDYVLRAELAGFASVIVRYAYVHHFGGQTTLRLNQGYAKRGLINRFPFYKKYLNHNKINHPIVGQTSRLSPEKNENIHSIVGAGFKTAQFERAGLEPAPTKKLVAGYRVKNAGRWFRRVLAKMSTVADEIVVFDDHSTDDTIEIAKSFDKVKIIHKSEFPERDFNEARDREKLLQLCKSLEPEWIIITDGDEELEEKFDRTAAEKLMNPVKPSIFGYIFRYITHWDSEDMQRTDGIFGQMANVRMVRNLPNQHIVSNHPQGFHCNSVPWVPVENIAMTPYRIRHYGYADSKDRMRKYDWYQGMDTDKRLMMIGAENYDH
ncbi:glycosyltransferase, partial [bacterium]|nr:glycosyltransferase [bacterium]